MMGDRNKEMQQILEDIAKTNAPVDRQPVKPGENYQPVYLSQAKKQSTDSYYNQEQPSFTPAADGRPSRLLIHSSGQQISVSHSSLPLAQTSAPPVSSTAHTTNQITKRRKANPYQKTQEMTSYQKQSYSSQPHNKPFVPPPQQSQFTAKKERTPEEL